MRAYLDLDDNLPAQPPVNPEPPRRVRPIELDDDDLPTTVVTDLASAASPLPDGGEGGPHYGDPDDVEDDVEDDREEIVSPGAPSLNAERAPEPPVPPAAPPTPTPTVAPPPPPPEPPRSFALPTAPGQQLHHDALYGLAGDIVRTIEPHTESDPAAVLIQTLIGVGNIIGRTAHAEVEGTRHYLNECVVLVGPSGQGKGSSWSQARRLLSLVDPEWASQRIKSGLVSGEGLIHALKDRRPAVAPAQPVQPAPQGQSPAPASAAEASPPAPQEQDKRLLIIETEFAKTLTAARRGSLSAILRQAWDGDTLSSMSKRSSETATNAHVSVIGHITADDLAPYVRSGGGRDAANGFLNRFLWIATRPTKVLPYGGSLADTDLEPLARRLRDAVAFARQVTRIGFFADSMRVWEQFTVQCHQPRPGRVGEVLGRARAHVLRLSRLYAVLDQCPTVRREHLLAAVALWRHVEASVTQIFWTPQAAPALDDRLLALMRGSPTGLTRTEIRNRLGRRPGLSQLVDAALERLLARGLVISTEVRTGGRRAEKWIAVVSASGVA